MRLEVRKVGTTLRRVISRLRNSDQVVHNVHISCYINEDHVDVHRGLHAGYPLCLGPFLSFWHLRTGSDNDIPAQEGLLPGAIAGGNPTFSTFLTFLVIS